MSLPISLDYRDSQQLDPLFKSTSVLLAPNGITMIRGANFTGAFVENSTCLHPPLSSQTIEFNIPTHSKSSFIQCENTAFSFRFTHTVVSAGTGGTGKKMRLISSAASFFTNMRLTSNGIELENIIGYDQIYNILLSATVTTGDRTGELSVSAGCEQGDTTSGLELPLTAGTHYFTFTIPLLSVISLNNPKGKLFPVGCLNDLRLSLTTNSILPIATYCTAAPSSQPTFGAPVLDEFQLSLKMIDIGSTSYRALQETLTAGVFQMRGTSYAQSTYGIGIQTTGGLVSSTSHKFASVESVFVVFTSTQTDACPNGRYDSFNPCLSEICVNSGGIRQPVVAINASKKPSQAMHHLMAALGGNAMSTYGGTLNRSSYGATLPSVPPGSDTMLVVPNAGVRPYSSFDAERDQIIIEKPNAVIYGFDISRCSGSALFSGAYTWNDGLQIEWTTTIANEVPLLMTSYALHDQIFIFDTVNKTVQVTR